VQILTGSLWILWVAVWTGTVGNRTNRKLLDLLRVDPQQGRGLSDDLQNFRVSQAVEDIAPIAVRGHQFGFAQGHQVLRDARLAQSQRRLHVAYACFCAADHQNNLDASRLADQAENFRDFFFRPVGRKYIRLHEYIIPKVQALSRFKRHVLKGEVNPDHRGAD
jgi:hypothetical protein